MQVVEKFTKDLFDLAEEHPPSGLQFCGDHYCWGTDGLLRARRIWRESRGLFQRTQRVANLTQYEDDPVLKITLYDLSYRSSVEAWAAWAEKMCPKEAVIVEVLLNRYPVPALHEKP